MGGKRPPLDEERALFEATVAAEGVTTEAGEGTGLSLVDAGLAGSGATSYVSMMAVIHPGDPTQVDSKDITAFTDGTGEVTVASAFKGGQVAAGVPYKIVTFRFVPAEVAALTTMVQTGQYYDRIFFDDATGIAGTAWPVGTPQVPSDVIADIITMCAARNLYTICVHGALTLGAAMQHYSFCGYEHEDVTDVLDLSGEDVDGSHIEGLIVTGAQGGAGFLTLVRCIANAITDFNGRMNFSSFWGGATSTFKDGGYIDLVDCESIYGVVTITVQAPTRASIKNWRGNLILTAQDGGICLVRGFKGTLEIDAMTAGTLNVYANGADITINADCSGGIINIYGNARVTDNSGATVVNDYTKETQLDIIEAAVASMAGGAFFGSYGPRNVEVDNDVDFGIMLYDPSGNIITTGEITPGTYTVNRVRGAVDTEIVGSPPLASSEAAGRVYMTYAFPAASWAVGDIFYITFIGISVTIDGVTTDYPNLFIWGRVVREPDIASLIGTAADAGDLGTLFGRHLRAYLGTHTHALVVVNDASSLDADLDTALKDWLEDIGFIVTVCDPADVAANLELNAFDVIAVSASCVAGDAGNLANLKEVEVPVVCFSAAIAVSAVFNMGATAATKAAQTQIEITDNSPHWLIAQALGNLTVTASTTIYTIATAGANVVEFGQEANGTNLLTLLKLPQGEQDDGTPTYAPFFDRYFIGVGDFTNMNAVWKAILDDLFMHCVMEKRFEEGIVQVKRGYQEDIPDTDFALAAIDNTLTADPPSADAENSIVDLDQRVNLTYVLRSLWVNVTDFGTAGTQLTFQLWVLLNGSVTSVDSVVVDALGIQNLMDIFGLQEVHADGIWITVITDSGSADAACSGTYRYAEARK